MSLFASEHGKGKRWVLLESTCGDSKETNAIAVVPANWQVEACPATIDRSYFEERADTDTSKFSFMYNNLAPYDWQQVSLAKSIEGEEGEEGEGALRQAFALAGVPSAARPAPPTRTSCGLPCDPGDRGELRGPWPVALPLSLM